MRNLQWYLRDIVTFYRLCSQTDSSIRDGRHVCEAPGTHGLFPRAELDSEPFDLRLPLSHAFSFPAPHPFGFQVVSPLDLPYIAFDNSTAEFVAPQVNKIPVQTRSD